MYIQITTRCNMSCAHCCFDCTADGIDMTKKTFNAAISICESIGENISLGGGEPTLHKKFMSFLMTAMIAECESVWLATNGSNTKISLFLAKLAHSGAIGCALSQDEYHDEIDDRVIEAFSRNNWNGRGVEDYREIRNVTGNKSAGLANAGRAAKSHIRGLLNQDVEDRCACNELFVTPDGRIWHCGCQKLQYGTVFNPQIPKNFHNVQGICSVHDEDWEKYLKDEE